MIPFIYCSTDETCTRLRVLSPHRSKDCGALPQGRAIETVLYRLPAEFRHDVHALSRQNTPWALVLDARLPCAWQESAWETVEFNGRTLAEQALVLRAVQPWVLPQPHSPAPPDSPRRIALLNYFPREEFDFIGHFKDLFKNGQIEALHPRFAAQQLGAHEELVIVAHGDQEGLKDQHGNTVNLSDWPLPKRLWLLACHEQRALYRLAQDCLNRGVDSVIMATGLLDAAHMSAIIRAWLTALTSTDPVTWLAEQRLRDDAVGGASALTVWGTLSSDLDPLAEWNRRTLCAHSSGTRSAPRLTDDQESFAQAIEAIGSGAAVLWPVTLDWLLTESLKLAENHDHGAMLRLEVQLARTHHAAPGALLALANSAYRRGRYEYAVTTLTQGMQRAAVTDDDALVSAQLLGLWANISIDLNVPEWGEWAVARHQCRELLDPELEQGQALRRLDWQARLALRRHQFDQALMHMQQKKNQQAGLDGHTQREISWLIYIQAWAHRLGHPVDPQYAQWVDTARQALAQIDVHDSAGNSPAGYWLRSLACHAWAFADHALLEPIERHLGNAHLSKIDPGPWAFARCYCALLRDDQLSMKPALAALDANRYWLEAAKFAELAGLEASPYMSKFLRLQEKVLHSVQQSPLELPVISADTLYECNRHAFPF